MDWLLCDRGPHHEGVNVKENLGSQIAKATPEEDFPTHSKK